MKKKYFFVTEVVPLLTLGLCPLIFIVFFFITIIIFKVSSCWFGEAIHCGCKTKVFFFFKKKILKEEPSAGEHSAIVQECFSTSAL